MAVCQRALGRLEKGPTLGASMIGRTLSHYQVLEEISRGGMGIVYRARDTKLDREVALKVLPPDLLRDERRKRRFVTEAKAAAKLQHPAIAVVHEIDDADDVTFIAMDLIADKKLENIHVDCASPDGEPRPR